MPVLGSISSCQAASSSQLSFRLAGAWGIPVPGGIAQTFNLLAPESTAATGLRREVARAGLLDGEGGGKQSWSLRREGFQDPQRGYTKLSHVFFPGLCACLVSLTPEPGYVWIQLHQRARGRLLSFTANGAWEGFDLPPDPSPAP